MRMYALLMIPTAGFGASALGRQRDADGVTVGGEIMTPVQTLLEWSVGLLLGMLICLEIGYRIGSYGVEKHLDLAHEGTGTIEAAVFALVGLLLAFTFGGAMSRLEARDARWSCRKRTCLARRICGWIFCLARSSRGCANCSANIWMRG